MSNLTPGKKAKGGKSVRLSAYLSGTDLEALEVLKKKKSAPQLSALLGQYVRQMLQEAGVAVVRCPECHAEFPEVRLTTVGDQERCPRCKRVANATHYDYVG